ncbi:MAG TPA: HAMP domain-containing sensor histidine kinase [Acidimicrobiales bacterium]|nr:HAMP domain-containing sensor histidine kinase [Acidimicrobiales bacterium]
MLFGGGSNETYRGPDRRRRQVESVPRIPMAHLSRQTVLVGLVIAIPILALVLHGATPAGLRGALQSLSALIAAAAGFGLLIAWKISGKAATGVLGVALLDFGILTLIYSDFSNLGLHSGSVVPAGRAVVCVVTASLVIAAFRVPEVHSALSPLRLLAKTALGGLVALGLLEMVLPVHSDIEGMVLTHRAVLLFDSVAWAAAAVVAVHGGRRRSVDHRWVGWVMAIFAGNAAVGSVTFSYTWGPSASQATVLVVTCLGLIGSLWELRWTVKHQDRYALTLDSNLREIRQEMEREQTELSERLHELRNSVSALRTADTTLRRYAGRLDDETRDHLADALSSELSRLQTLIEPGRRLKPVDFRLDLLVGPLVATQRACGSVIDCQVGPVLVRGDRDALAQVVHNLLGNARKYAPGSPISIAAGRVAGRVLLAVSDAGPGIPAEERQRVFARGTRGSTSEGTDGHGLGLHVAAQLMEAMGGSLRLQDTLVGTTFVIEIAAPVSSPAEVCRAVGSRPGRHLSTKPFVFDPTTVPG